jgi:hypothetical protein
MRLRQLTSETRRAVRQWMRKNHPECRGTAARETPSVYRMQLDALAAKAQAQSEFSDVYFSDLTDCAEVVLRAIPLPPRSFCRKDETWVAPHDWVPHSIHCICHRCLEADILVREGKTLDNLKGRSEVCKCAPCLKASACGSLRT